MVNVYVAADTGPSGFGVASRGLIRHLLEQDDVNLTVKTHFYGFNREGIVFQERGFPDTRFQEMLLRSGRVNEEHLIGDVREAQDRANVNLPQNLGSNEEVDPEECLIRQFEGKEDVWLTIGGANFADQAPQDDDIHTILSTDFNLDTVPHKWAYYLDRVDEVWVPSEWVKDAIRNRFAETHPHIVEKTYAFPYGVPMNYEPTAYDCEACPNQHQSGQPYREPCLTDDAFTFLVVSRFYHIKGLYRTIKAFIEEFRGDEPVRLFIKTTSNQQFDFNAEAAVQHVVNELGYPDPPEIGLKVEPFDTQHLYDLFGHVDAFVQASRAECFGIAQFQAAYCRTPVIVTDWSAQREFIPDGRDGFFKVREFDLERPEQESGAFMFQGGDQYPPDANWAVPDIDALGDAMRTVYDLSRDEREEQGEAARAFVEDRFQWKDRIQPRVERLREVARDG